jgi:hypothetical protein
VEGWATGAARTEVERARMAVAKMVLESMVAVCWWLVAVEKWLLDG